MLVGWDYAKTMGVDAQVSILIDPLSVLMVLVVTGVSMLIHLYSVAYMDSDAGYARFFAYLNFFVFSMLLLVLAANFVLLIVGWAFVGAASYLLISFWYRRTTATTAGIKAFVINVVGDVGLVLGTYFLFRHTGTVDFLQTFHEAKGAFAGHQADLTAGLICLLVGAFAKSAQIPLHTWLPDAMEGPTPVSALIHAATMVTAGVYLIARMHPLFELSDTASAVGAITGAVTLLVAGTIGLVVTDLKRVIAYSTMSQIGYMVMAVSSGAYVAGMFHLMTHAFFKALLFMAAGSIIGAMANEQSLDRMGGFKRALPFTYVCFVDRRPGAVGRAAVLGLLLQGRDPGHDRLARRLVGRARRRRLRRRDPHRGLHVADDLPRLLGRAGARGRRARARPPAPRRAPFNPANGEIEDTEVGFPGPEHHIAERALPMKLAMGTLAVLAVIGGFIQVPKVIDSLDKFLEPAFADSTLKLHPSTRDFLGLGVGTLLGLAGIAIAYYVWVLHPGTSAKWQARFGGAYRCSRTSGTSTRRSTAASSPRSAGAGASRSRRSSASSSTARSSAAPPASSARARPPRARCSRASCAPTPAC